VRRSRVWVLGSLAPLAVLGGCESIFGIGELPSPATDAGIDTGVIDTGKDSPRTDRDEGDSEAGCYQGIQFTPYPWKPPTPFGQAVCSTKQITDFITCLYDSNCTAFNSDPNKTTCLACLETNENAAEYGPFVTTAGGSLYEVNVGGCQANFDGDASATACGGQTNAYLNCLAAECSTCSDFTTEAPGGPTALCESTALNLGGACVAFNEDPGCITEFTAGVAKPCEDSMAYLTAWCGGDDAGTPADAGHHD
jgi:hypothetical protein